MTYRPTEPVTLRQEAHRDQTDPTEYAAMLARAAQDDAFYRGAHGLPVRFQETTVTP